MTGTKRHLRARGGGPQQTTSLELFFDLVYVLAVTQLSHVLLHQLSWANLGRMGFLLLVVWWAWIYTTWMINWFDPESIQVRLVVVAVALFSLLMAAALPEAFRAHGLLFAGSYAGLQVGRNLAGALLLRRRHPLGETFERLLAWSVLAGALWIAGGLLHGDQRLLLWGPALAIELAAPLVGYWAPRRGRIGDFGHPIEGSHFAERCQGFLIIALGESIVVTGATAAQAGLSAEVVAALAVAFLETSALWWLYFSEVAVNSRRQMESAENSTDLARDAYTYFHLPIVAGVILTAVGTDYLTLHPGRSLDGAQAAVTLAGPIVYLLGELLFRHRMIGTSSSKRLVAIAGLAVLGLGATHVPALGLGLVLTGILIGLGTWEYEAVPANAG
ncbi:MAG: low temperature requirement protein A [Actinomycetota bacterium]|nr:low temperature requirement protein A [Actinomycetota bacterium]